MSPSATLRLQLRLNGFLRTHVYRSRLLARILYGVWLSPSGSISYWELGTLAMRHALRRHLIDGMRVLEIGTGPYATLAQWAATRRKLDITATEIEPEWAATAAAACASNGLDIDVKCSDLLSDVKGEFDLVWFVPPHTAQAIFDAQMQILAINAPSEREQLSKRSCGGLHGWEIVDRFLAGSAAHLKPDGKILVAINLAHQSSTTITSMIARHGLTLLDAVPLSLFHYQVFVAGRSACRR